MKIVFRGYWRGTGLCAHSGRYIKYFELHTVVCVSFTRPIPPWMLYNITIEKSNVWESSHRPKFNFPNSQGNPPKNAHSCPRSLLSTTDLFWALLRSLHTNKHDYRKILVFVKKCTIYIHDNVIHRILGRILNIKNVLGQLALCKWPTRKFEKTLIRKI